MLRLKGWPDCPEPAAERLGARLAIEAPPLPCQARSARRDSRSRAIVASSPRQAGLQPVQRPDCGRLRPQWTETRRRQSVEIRTAALVADPPPPAQGDDSRTRCPPLARC